jgi:hypothetical protein
VTDETLEVFRLLMLNENLFVVKLAVAVPKERGDEKQIRWQLCGLLLCFLRCSELIASLIEIEDIALDQCLTYQHHGFCACEREKQIQSQFVYLIDEI